MAERQAQQHIEDIRHRCDDRVNDAEKRIERRAQDVKEFYEKEVIAEIKATAERKVTGFQSDIKRLKDDRNDLQDRLDAISAERDSSKRKLQDVEREK
mmetsp:Transcript_8588/g.13283  ORF Transcript_8588/g.13283 Transcript_8588/m.13283 type:complete len:98 (-) Transcript_8588:3668-3961(-)